MGFVAAIGGLLGDVETAVLALGASPWLLLAVLVLACLDGFFPPVPSESVVLAVAVLAVAGDVSWLYLVLLAVAAAAGAWCGDLVAHAIGATIPLERLRIFRGRRGRSALATARRALARRGSAYILIARFLPAVRVAVNITAGASGYERTRFLPVAALASLLWAGYYVVLGVTVGHLLRERPLLAVVIGITSGMLVGLLVDGARAQVLQRIRARTAPSHRFFVTGAIPADGIVDTVSTTVIAPPDEDRSLCDGHGPLDVARAGREAPRH